MISPEDSNKFINNSNFGDNINTNNDNTNSAVNRKHPLLLPTVNEMKLKSNTDRKARLPRRRNVSSEIVNDNSLNKRSKYIKQMDNNHKVKPEAEPIDYHLYSISNNKKSNSSHLPYELSANPDSNPIQAYSRNNVQPLPAHLSNYLFKSVTPKPLASSSFSGQNVQKNEEENKNTGEQANIPIQYPAVGIEQNRIEYFQQMSRQENAFAQTNLIPAYIQESLVRVETHLKGIEREMNIRNQIETNKIYLEFAKFKYLNPGFAIQNE